MTNNILANGIISFHLRLFSSKAMQISSVTGQRGQKDISLNWKISSKTSFCLSLCNLWKTSFIFLDLRQSKMQHLANTIDNGIWCMYMFAYICNILIKFKRTICHHQQKFRLSTHPLNYQFWQTFRRSWTLHYNELSLSIAGKCVALYRLLLNKHKVVSWIFEHGWFTHAGIILPSLT